MDLKFILIKAIDIYIFLIILRAIFSWFHLNSQNNFFQLYLFLIKLTEPVLGKLRNLQIRILPNSPIDFSPLLALFILNFIQNIVLTSNL